MHYHGLLSHMLSGFWNRHLVFKKDLESKDLINLGSHIAQEFSKGLVFFVLNYRLTHKRCSIFWSVSKYQTIYCASCSLHCRDILKKEVILIQLAIQLSLASFD